MRKILFAMLGLVGLASCNIGVCQKNCGIDFGKCLIQTFDMESCLKGEASCALDCLKGVNVELAKTKAVPEVENIGVC
jgi:hypothetical protein